MVLRTRLRFGIRRQCFDWSCSRYVVFLSLPLGREHDQSEHWRRYAKTKTKACWQYHSDEELFRSTRLANGDVEGIIVPNSSQIPILTPSCSCSFSWSRTWSAPQWSWLEQSIMLPSVWTLDQGILRLDWVDQVGTHLICFFFRLFFAWKPLFIYLNKLWYSPIILGLDLLEFTGHFSNTSQVHTHKSWEWN